MNYKSQTVSAVVITHNNAGAIDRCLSSLHWVDELIVVDRGSTDGTLAIARNFSDKVHFHPSGNRVILRQDALTLATCDWILCIEPDEWVEEMLKHEIDGVLLNTNTAIHAYTVPRRIKFQGGWLERGEPERFVRMVRKGKWRVREDWDAALETDGETGHLDYHLGYAPYGNIEDLVSAVNRQSTMAAYRHLKEHGIRKADQGLWCLLWSAKWAAVKHYFLQGAIGDGYTGAVMTITRYLEVFLKFAKIRSLTRKGA